MSFAEQSVIVGGEGVGRSAGWRGAGASALIGRITGTSGCGRIHGADHLPQVREGKPGWVRCNKWLRKTYLLMHVDTCVRSRRSRI